MRGNHCKKYIPSQGFIYIDVLCAGLLIFFIGSTMLFVISQVQMQRRNYMELENMLALGQRYMEESKVLEGEERSAQVFHEGDVRIVRTFTPVTVHDIELLTCRISLFRNEREVLTLSTYVVGDEN